MKHVAGIFLSVVMNAFALGTGCWADQGILLVQAKDLQNRPVPRVEMAVEGTHESYSTGPTGIARIKLDPAANANDWITIEVRKSPRPQSFVIISPWDSKIQIPPLDGITSDVISVVLANRGDPALLENATALAAMAAKIIKADGPTSKDIDPAQHCRDCLEAIAKTFGLAPEDVDKAIHVWGEKTDDPYRRGIAALYESNYALASQRLEEAWEGLQDSPNSRAGGADAAFFLGRSKYREGKYQESAAAYRSAQKFRPEDPTILHSLALSTDLSGDDTGAELLYRQALAMDEKTLGPEHLTVSGDLANLASLLESKGDLAGAEPLYRRVLEIEEKMLGLDHPKVATDLNTLGLLLQAKGNSAEAEPLYWRARSIDEKVLGPEHRNVARDLSNLASVSQAIGDYAGAEPLYRRALQIDQKALGPDDPKVGTDLTRLAALLQVKGDLAGAEPLYRRALTIDEKALGASHPKVRSDLNHLANLLENKGDLEKSAMTYRRVLAMDEKVFGPAHPNLGADLNNLARLSQAQGDLSRAETIYQQALAIDEKALGPDHPDVAADLCNLAGVLQSKGNLTEAERLYLRALSIDKRSLEENDPKIQMIRRQLKKLTEKSAGRSRSDQH